MKCVCTKNNNPQQEDNMIKKDLLPSVFGGVYISIGALIYLALEKSVTGALFFSLGILLCIFCNGHLFTRAFPLGVYTRFQEYSVRQILIVYAGNFIGTALMALLISQTFLNDRIADLTIAVAQAKISDTFISTLISGTFAGLLVAFAVMFKRRGMNILFVVVTIAAFVILGFDHCIANMFYYSVYTVNGGALNIALILDILAATLGNMIGGGLACLIEPRESK